MFVCTRSLARCRHVCTENISFRSEPLTRKNIYPTDMNDIIVRTIILYYYHGGGCVLEETISIAFIRVKMRRI